MANKDFKIKNGLDIQSPLPVSMGGTGQTTAENTLNALLPSQAGNSNKVLASDGTNTSWVAQTTAYQRGGTESRPASPTVGDLYYNTDTNAFEQYTSSGWFAVAAAPGIPTGVTATNQGSGRAFNDGQASVAFTSATSGGAPSTFTITPSPTTSPSTFTGSASPITVTNLASSTQYTYTATATSAYGTSAASSASAGVTATTVPAAPTISAESASETTATITITPGATGGSAITQYSIVSDPVTTTQTTSSSPYTFTGLTTGTAYTFTATATNTNGTSAISSASNSITPSVSGSFESIASYSLASNGTVTFSSIPQNYKILQVRFHGASQDHYTHMKTNLGVGTWSMGPRNLTNSLGINISAGYYPDGFYLNNGGLSVTYRGSMITEFIDYASTSKTKTAVNWYGTQTGSASQNNQLNMWWDSTSAINSITISSDGGYQLSTGTVVGLYGILG
jgi:hypothetical protein